MKVSLQVRLSQHLALTPQLQQSIRLLQLSTLELHQEVEQMLEQNPFLETEDEGGSAWELPLDRGPEPDRATAAEADANRGEVGAEAEGAGLADLGPADFCGSEREDWANGTEGDDFDGIRELPSLGAAGASTGGSGEADDDFEPQSARSAHTGLADHLRAQLPDLRLPGGDATAVLMLIESLDADGYLADPLEEIAAALAPAADEDMLDDVMSRLRCALHWLRRLDPPGLGARSLGECLQLQLNLAPPSDARAIAITICSAHLELLARRDLKKLGALTGADDALLRQAQALIVACEPKPGRAFTNTESQIVVPDVVVQRSGRTLKVSLNPDVMPKLRINDLYAAALRGPKNGVTAGLSTRLQEARWFMKNIQQRFDTILRVSKAIVERQRAFFMHGEIAMKPLVLREIADELGLHESTISRVTTAKYMATPGGTFELKYFFGSSLHTEAGGSASSTAVRALIKQFVAAENNDKPLSDSALSGMLEEQGIQVARRTVAKYRDALKIAPANLRRPI